MNNNEQFNPYDYILDFDDKDHLIFCEESNLHKRILPLKSAVNMRDIGGYTNKEGKHIKWNKIFRGEELSHLSPEDQKEFEKLGVKYVFDFRQPDRAKNVPDDLPSGAEYFNYPLLQNFKGFQVNFADPRDHIKFMKKTYKHQVENSVKEVAKALKILADDKDAVIYAHCTNGKDRTGFFILLLMLLAGIDKDKIVSEYSLTNLTVNRAQKVLGASMADDVGHPVGILRNYFGVDPEWLKIQLDYINDNYDSVEDYLLDKTDLTEEDIKNIKNNILE